jgi:hypothetical protein
MVVANFNVVPYNAVTASVYKVSDDIKLKKQKFKMFLCLIKHRNMRS